MSKQLFYLLVLALSALPLSAQVRVTGKVSDQMNNPLPGAGITVQGTTKGVSSDFDGNYQIEANEGDVLVFSFVGFETQTKKITAGGGNKITINVLLQEEAEQLTDVVVVGYGTQRKSDLTGAVSQVKADAFKNQPVLNTSSALQGRVAGVSISNTSGAPGGEVKIRIRGANSVNNNNAPLIVLDGVAMGSLGLQDINPYDIATIDVLKDASATAVYGSRGANGVILISTKTGKTDMLLVDFKTYTSFTQPIRKYDLMNGSEYATHANLISGGTAFPAGFKNANTNWQDLMFNTDQFTQNYQLSVTGGNKNIRYYVSGFYQDQPGTLLNTNMTRGGIRSNLDFRISDKLNASVTMYVERSDSRNTSDLGSKGNPVMASLTWDPTSEIYVDGDPANGYIRHVSSPIFNNPYMILKEQYNKSLKTAGFANAKATYRFTDFLKFDTNISIDGYMTRNGSVSNDWISPGNMRSSQSYYESYNIQNSNFLTYQQKFDKHDIGAVLLYETTRYENRNFNADGSGLVTTSNGYDNLGLNKTHGIGSGYFNGGLMSFMARATYGYDNRYLLTATVRRDGSSKFQGNNKWGTFPSFSVGWNISNEAFMEEQNLFSNLKLRAGWGGTGNQNIAAYSTLGTLAQGLYSFGTTSAGQVYLPNGVLTPDLRWETSYQTNIGLDMAFLDGALTFGLDFYNKDTKDLLLDTKINKYDGGGSKKENIGKVNNKGIEAAIGYNLQTKNGFGWSTNFNLAYNKNKVVDLGEDTMIFRPRMGGAWMGTEVQVIKVGESLGTFFLIPWEGIYQQDDATLGFKAGDNKYTDTSGNNSIGYEDRVVSGSAMPKIVIGFNNTFTYKNFDFNILIQGAYGHKILNTTYAAAAMPTSDVTYPTMRDVMNHWTPQNTGAEWASPTSSTNKHYMASTQFLQDGSFTRIKNISIGYTLPKEITKNYGLKIYASAQNVLTFTKYKGFDPENSSTSSSSDADAGIDMGAYPSNRTFTLGVNITFGK